MNDILAVAVTYNRLAMLRECISHLNTQTYPCDILIVDNASTDGTEHWAASSDLSTDDHKVFYRNTGFNSGGAGGFNFGMRAACEMGYKYVWIMDDDAFPESDCLEKLMKAAENTDFGFLSSIVKWTDGSICRMNWQRKLHLPKNRAEHHITDEDLKGGPSLIPVQSATFVSLLFPADVIRRVGLPIREFFIWCDDIEFTRRIALKYSMPCYAVTDSIIIHHTANNAGTDLSTDSADRIPRYNYAFRNENYMYRQYGLKGFGYYILVCAYNIFKILRNAPDNKLRRIGVVVRNFFKGLFFNPPVEQL
ncbi:MAG: glycosyltransferase family 2 protein [Parasporobacterium sp.]|nr:glycosyltransferase family 2 protein [Parasporobacterium sp.]